MTKRKLSSHFDEKETLKHWLKKWLGKIIVIIEKEKNFILTEKIVNKKLVNEVNKTKKSSIAWKPKVEMLYENYQFSIENKYICESVTILEKYAKSIHESRIKYVENK